MNLRTTLLLLASCIALSACNNTVTDFVKGADPSSDQPSRSPASQDSGTIGFKISPGHAASTSASISAKASITPTNSQLIGSTLSAKITMSQTRLNP